MYPRTRAAQTPDKPALVMDDGRVTTYARLEDRSSRVAHALRDLGVRPGDAVALLTDNAPESFEVYWATMRSGFYITAVNHHLKPAEVAYIVDDCGATVLIASAGLAELAEAIGDLTPRIAHRFAFGAEVSGHRPYTDLLDADPLPDDAEQPRGSDMLYSSGTTGRPKGVRTAMLPLRVDEPGDPMSSLTQMLFGVDSDTVYLSMAPIYHAAPLRWCGAVVAWGGTVVMTASFDAEELLRLVEQHRVTHLQVVPTMFVRLLQLPEQVRRRYDLSSLRQAVHAAAPCPPEVKRRMIEWWGPVLTEYYGSTEGNGFTAITSAEWLTHEGSVGRTLLGVAHVCDDDGRELPAGEVGTIYFERETLPFRYHGDPEKTAAAQHPEHETWTAVGDVGYLDDEGYLYLTDRKAFTIISGGVNVYPQEIENVLTLHPAVYDVAVVGLPDDDLGERVAAFVQVREGVSGDDALAAELIEAVRAELAGFKAPRVVHFVDHLPRTPTGKLVKRRLVEAHGG
ncbi:acyl-CoA synthetase [Nocardioides acrostichi]|uniref:Acyl-CoA synthetase n=1 Tax=Nocardioides acrostichi TaxID=2784339 RepID=A0A930V2N0_9ACTN|nr:acyl-CoA synthetase [Nocardioides acrostichi]MBF4162677.1 acyl-CoA synthetase [Nocardioides acrostichi]